MATLGISEIVDVGIARGAVVTVTQVQAIEGKLALAVLDCLDPHVAVLDHTGLIVFTNQAWSRFAAKNALAREGVPAGTGVGANYLAVCRSAEAYSSESAVQALRGIHDVIAGRQREFKLEYPCHSPTKQRWFLMKVTPVPRTRPRQVVVAHTDISSQKLAQFEAERAAAELTELFQTLRDSASRVKSLIATAPGSRATEGLELPRQQRPVAKAWLTDAQRLRMLSSREKEVLRGLARGERIADISSRLGLSAKSVSTYRARLMEKLKVESTVELISLVSRVGVIR